MLLVAACAVGILLLCLPVAGSNDILCEFPSSLCTKNMLCDMCHHTFNPFPSFSFSLPMLPAILLTMAFLLCSFTRWPRWEKFFGQHGAVRREANKVGEMIGFAFAMLNWTRKYSTNVKLYS